MAPSSELPERQAAMLQMQATYCATIMVPMMLQVPEQKIRAELRAR